MHHCSSIYIEDHVKKWALSHGFIAHWYGRGHLHLQRGGRLRTILGFGEYNCFSEAEVQWSPGKTEAVHFTYSVRCPWRWPSVSNSLRMEAEFQNLLLSCDPVNN